jgi:diphosphomevalonate decarboxylase
MKATAVAPANIAFIKYWGKADFELRLPLNDSISMNLSGAQTTTTVEFIDVLKTDDILGEFTVDEKARIEAHLDRIRAMGGVTSRARVTTQNSFPASSGIASSASGFAALTMAASQAAGLTLSEKELSVLARLGSGSACRSIPDGFVHWVKGDSSDTSFAHSLHPHTYWDIRDILAIVSREKKSVSSGAGMRGAATSPHFPARLAAVPGRIAIMTQALAGKNFQTLGEVVEKDCLDMHKVMMTQTPRLTYWTEATQKLMAAVADWRGEGLSVYFTIDAGPNVHLICQGKDEQEVLKRVQSVPGVLDIIRNEPAVGAHLI